MTIVDNSAEALARHRELLPIATGKRAAREMFAELKKRPWTSAFGFVLTSLSASAGVLAPWLIGNMVDAVLGNASSSTIIWLAAMVACAGIAQGAFMAWSHAHVAVLGQTILASLRERVISRAVNLPAGKLESAGIGDALSRVADDVDVATRALNQVIPQLVNTVFVIAFTFSGLAVLDWRLGVAGFVVLPIYWFALRWFLPRTAVIYRKERVALGNRAHSMLGAIHGTPTVHAYGIEQQQLRIIGRFSKEAYDLSMQWARYLGTLVTKFNRAEWLGLSLIVVVGYFLVQQGEVSVGAVTTAALYFYSLFWPLASIIFLADDLQSAGASLARMVGVIDVEVEQDPAEPQVPRNAGLRVSGVSHSYGKGRTVLHDISLDLRPGESIALVGASGAGKTTLAAIMAGTIEPVTGLVRYGDVELHRIGVEARRRFVALISQESHVFRGTLAQDLRIAAPEASDDELWAALEKVEAAGWVRALPALLQTEVGEKGHRLTPEQGQHLALARLVLADPRIVIMDEATADAGSSGARHLERGAVAAAAGRTVVIVAHRLSQAMLADRIIVMDSGRIIEQGSHSELVSAGGTYATLWDAWSSS